MRKVLLLYFFAVVWISSASAIATSRDGEYVPNELIVKFRQPVADIIEKHAKANTPISSLNLSQNLNGLNTKYKAKAIKPLCKGFKDNNERIKALIAKEPCKFN